MNRSRVSLSLVCLISLLATSPAVAVTIATVPVGSPGNLPDPANFAQGQFGAVPYRYNIGTYDVTNAQYAEFLNAKASTADPFGLWNSKMAPPGFASGISRNGSGPFTYSVEPGYENKPMVYETWIDAIRFVN
jgi:sulfatase modifying factor 1